MTKTRLDVLLMERGLADSRAQAQRLIMAGQVRSNDQVLLKPSILLSAESPITLDQRPKYVSRGGEKLEAALKAFDVQVQDRLCADVGCSTGGFTDCLLQHGARQVYAIDVGKGILDWKLRQDARVVVMEETNARYITHLPQPVDLVTIDASFISLKILLPVVKDWLLTSTEGEPAMGVIALIKPQFEAGRKLVSRGKGVVRDPLVHQQVIQDVLGQAQMIGYSLIGLIRSPILGPKGNTEFLAFLGWQCGPSWTIQELLERCFVQGEVEVNSSGLER